MPVCPTPLLDTEQYAASNCSQDLKANCDFRHHNQDFYPSV